MSFQQTNINGRWTDKLRAAFKPRELFVHDGRSLKRLRIGSKIQIAAAASLTAIVAWSGFATVSVASTMNSDVSEMQRQVAEMQQQVQTIRTEAQEHAHALEQRQAFLRAMFDGTATPEQVARMIPTETSMNDVSPELAAAYGNAEAMQDELAAQATQAHQQRIQQTAQVVRRLGVDPRRFNGVGGPYEEIGGPDNADARFLALFNSWRRLERMEAGVASIPSIMPVQGARFTSGFGVRSDPFRGRAAMHAGIDMAGPIGTPIYATADGVAIRAGTASGYGNLVEIDHGAGIATRYGHLSRIIVEPGAQVRRGQLIGLMGSTGRSTGSHLHYEVRIDGRAVNAVPFLQSGQALAALQGRATLAGAQSNVAQGGPVGGTRR